MDLEDNNNNVVGVVEDEMIKIQNFFSNFQEPANLCEVKERVEQFITRQETAPIVLITSGGTSVPLEHNTVRFVHNFSAGCRGAASAEYFLEKGYLVIFMYRHKSLEPFSRHVNTFNLLESLVVNNCNNLEVCKDLSNQLRLVCDKYQSYKNNLLMITFTTLSEYLFYLREVAVALRPLQSRATLYLAAAVSDFYIPSSYISTHKIESNEPLSLHLEIVPKMLRPLVKYWAPKAFIVSFKLETNENILLTKARKALHNYGHHLVIANQLHSRKYMVLIVTETEEKTIITNNNDQEIEYYIVNEVVDRHQKFCQQQQTNNLAFDKAS